MTGVLTPPPSYEQSPLPSSHTDGITGWREWWGAPLWRRFTPLQLVVLALASIAPALIAGLVGAATFGLISTETLTEVALGAGENPGMITFGAMFLASPVQWLTGRSQVRVRKYLGIAFFLLAVSNFAMFVIERGIAASLSAPLLVAGCIALTLATPLFLTSSWRAQRAMGMRRWRTLHRLTYVIAAALMAHVILVGDVGLGIVLITMGWIARLPAVKQRLVAQGKRRSIGTAADLASAR